MRKLPILLFALFVFSCSKHKEPDPDLTTNFIGLWKTEIQKSAQYDIWTTYGIKRISNDLVKVDVKQYVDFHLGDDDDYSDEYTLDSVKVEAYNILKIRNSRTRGNQKVAYDGKGVLVGNTLTLDIIIDWDNQNQNNLFKIRLTKQ